MYSTDDSVSGVESDNRHGEEANENTSLVSPTGISTYEHREVKSSYARTDIKAHDQTDAGAHV